MYYSKESEKLISDLITIAANNNYIPAVKLKLWTLGKDSFQKNDPIYEKLYQLGSTYYYFSRRFTFENDYDTEQQWVFARAFEKISNSRAHFIGLKSKLKNDIPNDVELKADELINGMASMVYIDGFTSRDKWVEM